jgi:DNA-binding Lrp family transcriptional regulator
VDALTVAFRRVYDPRTTEESRWLSPRMCWFRLRWARQPGWRRTVRELQGVTSADDVTGPYDVIVCIEAPTLDDLGKRVVSKIQAVDGITRSFTCVVMNL